MPPLSLTTEEMDLLLALARPIEQRQRDQFLQEMAGVLSIIEHSIKAFLFMRFLRGKYNSVCGLAEEYLAAVITRIKDRKADDSGRKQVAFVGHVSDQGADGRDYQPKRGSATDLGRIRLHDDHQGSSDT